MCKDVYLFSHVESHSIIFVKLMGMFIEFYSRQTMWFDCCCCYFFILDLYDLWEQKNRFMSSLCTSTIILNIMRFLKVKYRHQQTKPK